MILKRKQRKCSFTSARYQYIIDNTGVGRIFFYWYGLTVNFQKNTIFYTKRKILVLIFEIIDMTGTAATVPLPMRMSNNYIHPPKSGF